ncbi:hypothetical protein [Thermonema sp.]|uniref:hypothetical protein n=1 Tax=Thermonema sp. TaxID=2231181 RepID=UPI002590E0FF|nr:hypothetical protein [Thermonema sp.]
MKYPNILEEELKNKVAQDYFWLYDCTKIIGKIDFCVCMHQSQTTDEVESLLWAEAKRGSSEVHKSFVQLILTIGKERTFDKYLPPAFLGAFDAEKIAFLPYSDIQEFFYLNDFNWNVAPSDHTTKEFQLIYDTVKNILDSKTLLFYFDRDDRDLQRFIRLNFQESKRGLTKIRIDKNNFISVYNKWLEVVKPTIAVDWEKAKARGIIDGDFYLADLLSANNVTLKDKLFVLLKSDHYELDREIDESGFFKKKEADFQDKQQAHTQFWNRYERPPKEEYWDYIVERRDLLVPQDIRERKGSFFTPRNWVALSQQYLTNVLGEDWQDEYFVWDCAAGTGNLLTGLTNKYNIYASTLDRQDVEVMHDRISNGANLLPDHVFQFDFLNDEWKPVSSGGKIPDSLFKIISDAEKRKKLIVYINPPYAEATTARTVTRTGKNKAGVSTEQKANHYFKSKIGSAANELFALFMAQVYEKMPGCILAQFSKLKFVQGSNFDKFKQYFRAKYLGGFVVPSNTFDNVRGQFPIGFTIWDLGTKEEIKNIICQVYNENEEKVGVKTFYGDLPKRLNDWFVQFEDKNGEEIGLLSFYPPDFQNNNKFSILSKPQARYCKKVTPGNIIQVAIYFAVRHCLKATWLNDRDQFLYPNDGWKHDKEFQTDCLIFTLFHDQNRISSKYGTNHWIPFTEQEVGARDRFDSHFMNDYINGKIKIEQATDLFQQEGNVPIKLQFSAQAKEVFEAGKALWKYYHQQPHNNINASFYDIKEYFQGRNEKGKLNKKSNDKTYMKLITQLREKLEKLAEKIQPKVYLYGFLRP